MGTRRTEVGRTGARFGSIGVQQNSGRHEAPVAPPEPPEPAEPAVGLTGARFGPLSERRRLRDEPDGTPAEEVTGPIPVVDAVRVDETLLSESDVLIRPYA